MLLHLHWRREGSHHLVLCVVCVVRVPLTLCTLGLFLSEPVLHFSQLPPESVCLLKGGHVTYPIQLAQHNQRTLKCFEGLTSLNLYSETIIWTLNTIFIYLICINSLPPFVCVLHALLGCFEPNSSHLYEQQMLLSTETFTSQSLPHFWTQVLTIPDWPQMDYVPQTVFKFDVYTRLVLNSQCFFLVFQSVEITGMSYPANYFSFFMIFASTTDLHIS